MKNIEVLGNEENDKFEIRKTETKTESVFLSLQELREKLNKLRSKRSMDAQSFLDSLNKTDAEIAELEDLISKATDLNEKKRKDQK